MQVEQLRPWQLSQLVFGSFQQEKRNLKVGDIVIVISPDSPRAHWPLAKAIQVFPGKYGKMRVAQIQMGQKSLKRLVNKLCLLENC